MYRVRVVIVSVSFSTCTQITPLLHEYPSTRRLVLSTLFRQNQCISPRQDSRQDACKRSGSDSQRKPRLASHASRAARDASSPRGLAGTRCPGAETLEAHKCQSIPLGNLNSLVNYTHQYSRLQCQVFHPHHPRRSWCPVDCD